jgi:hypothetical protein
MDDADDADFDLNDEVPQHVASSRRGSSSTSSTMARGYFFEKGRWRSALKLTKQESQTFPENFGRGKDGRVTLSGGNYELERDAAMASAK